MNIRHIITSALLLATFGIFATERNIPKTYYSRMDGLSGSALKTAAYQIISNHTRLSYKSLWNYYPETDTKNNGTEWWDIYDDEVKYVRNGYGNMNKEHSFPKSWWGGSTNDAYSDIFHLYPVLAKANSARSNWAYGEVNRSGKITYDNGVSVVGVPVSGQGGGSTYVFEPDDRYKGDLARTYFYMVTCYQNLNWAKTYHVSNNTYPTLNAWSVELLMRWHHDDPVSQKEIDRNEAIYKIQGNRNPFIDFPDLAEYLWGDKVGEKFTVADHLGGEVDPDPTPGPTPDPEETPTLLSPSQNFILEFGEVALGHSGSTRLLVKGENLDETKSLRLMVYDNMQTDDAALFTIEGKSSANISATAANGADGLFVTVDYKPTSLGEHESRMVISGAGIKGSIGIALKGICLPEPSPSAPTATPATDITSTSYVANWTPVEGEEVDSYIVNRTQYINGKATTTQIETEDTELRIEDFCGSESYTVQAVRLDVASPESNSIVVGQSSITGVNAGNRFGIVNLPDGIAITCSATIAELRVLDLSGRTVAIFYDVNNNDELSLPTGVYILHARGIAAPVKVVVSNNSSF